MSTRFDVAVVGGGAAGVAAALCSAAAGARTALIERSDLLGGNAALAWVHTICGLYEPADDGGPRAAHSPFVERLTQTLRRRGAAREPERAGRVWVLPTHPPKLAAVLEDACARAPGLEVFTRHTVEEALLATAPDAESELGVRPADGEMRSLRVAALVDASGDATVAALGGAAVSQAPSDALQIPSYIFRVGGVDTSEIEGFGRLRLTHAVAGAVREGALPEACESVLVRRGEADDEVYVTLNLPRPEDYAPLDPTCIETLGKDARAWAEQVVAHLHDTRPAFRHSRVIGWPRRIGIRETRRIGGRATLDADAVLGGTRTDDEVARSPWPIELWPDHRRARFRHPRAACSIPSGALTSRTHPRLAAAGRCISATHEALGAVRVIGTSLATGQAAGVISAHAVDAGVALADVAPVAVRDHIADGSLVP
jgi:hypothetical protein